jgi:putative transposase
MGDLMEMARKPRLEFAEESDPSAHDSLAKRFCHGWAVASEEVRRNLQKLDAKLGKPEGWKRREVTELRKEKWERALTALLRRAGKTEKQALDAQKRPSERSA